MIIDYLGHSEVLINIENSNGETIKILSDAWLSSYSVADLMQRNPIIDIDWEKLKNLDAVFISHSHMDHLDPYTLIKIYKKLENKPLLLLPETLSYLKELLTKELDCEIKVLKNKKTFNLNGINIQGVIFPDWMNTNEADVMTLCIWNDEEIAFSEIDIVPPDMEEGIGYVYKLFTQKDFKTRLYLSTRNELEGNLTIIDLKPEDRESFAQEYKEKRVVEMYQHYNNIFALEEENINANIYTLPGFVKAFVGQGIIFPADEFGCDALKLQIMSLNENVELEKQVCEDFGFNFPIYALNKVGDKIGDCSYNWLGRYVFEKGDLQKIETIPFVKGRYFKTKQDLICTCQRKLKKEPVLQHNKLLYEDLRNKEGNPEDFYINKQIKRVLNYINTRFLPYQMGRLDANLKNLALESNGKYIIQLKIFKDNKVNILGYYVWELGDIGFGYIGGESCSNYNETYFIEDLIDFLDGKIELYSNFWSYLEQGTNIYLWECLGADFINNDILIKKFSYHFSQAKKGLTQKEQVLKIIKN